MGGAFAVISTFEITVLYFFLFVQIDNCTVLYPHIYSQNQVRSKTRPLLQIWKGQTTWVSIFTRGLSSARHLQSTWSLQQRASASPYLQIVVLLTGLLSRVLPRRVGSRQAKPSSWLLFSRLQLLFRWTVAAIGLLIATRVAADPEQSWLGIP